MDEEELEIFTCVDCGAFSFISLKDVVHHKGCEEGSSEKWGKFYSEIDLEEERLDEEYKNILNKENNNHDDR